MTQVSQPAAGPSALLRGFKLMWRPGIRIYVIIPLIINTLVLGGLLFGFAGWVDGLVSGWLEWLPGWLDWLRGLMSSLLWIVAIVLFCFGFTLTANLIGAPFNGFLAERVEQELTGIRPDNGLSIAQDVKLSLITELRKLWYMIWRAAVLGIISLILMFIMPPAVPVLWALFSAWFLALEYIDYPASNHGLDFKSKKKLLTQDRMLSLAFGGSTVILTSIPILNLFVMPAAVTAATILWTERLQTTTSGVSQ